MKVSCYKDAKVSIICVSFSRAIVETRLFNFPYFLHTERKFTVKQREFPTSIVSSNTIVSGYCNYFNESVGICQATYLWTMHFLNVIGLIKCYYDNLSLSYITSCQDVHISCTQCLCARGWRLKRPGWNTNAKYGSL